MHYPAPHCIVCARIEHIRGCVMSEKICYCGLDPDEESACDSPEYERDGACMYCDHREECHAPAQPTEPVCWRLHVIGDNWNYTEDKELAASVAAKGSRVVPLYEHAAPQPTESELRERFEATDCGCFEREGGRYLNTAVHDMWRGFLLAHRGRA